VATRLLTHTQVLDDSTAVLTGATAREFADGVLAVLTNTRRAGEIGAQARLMAETKYSYERYLERTRQACAALQGNGFPDPSRGRLPDKEPVAKDLA
jgi:hypothetical protein